MAITNYSAVRVFTATKFQDRERLGETVTAWLAGQRDIEVVETQVLQSSDASYHCLTVVLFYRPLARAAAGKAA